MDPVSILLVGLSAVLTAAPFIWSMHLLVALDADPVESGE